MRNWDSTRSIPVTCSYGVLQLDAGITLDKKVLAALGLTRNSTVPAFTSQRTASRIASSRMRRQAGWLPALALADLDNLLVRSWTEQSRS